MAYGYRSGDGTIYMGIDVSLWVAIALSVRVNSRQPLSPMPIPCTAAWLSRVPRRCRTLAIQALPSPSSALSAPMRQLALSLRGPTVLESVAAMCLRMYTCGSIAPGPRQHALYRLRSARRMFMFTVRSDFLRLCCCRELVHVPIIISFQNF